MKERHSLWVTPPERDALARILSGCPGQRLPSAASTAVPATGTTKGGQPAWTSRRSSVTAARSSRASPARPAVSAARASYVEVRAS